MGIGLLPGMWLFASIPERPLKLILGIFMIVVGLKGLKETVYDRRMIRLGKKQAGVKRAMPNWVGNTLLACGGIIHGAFASGGPFVVVYATEAIPGKSRFRATLCALWATLNGIMIIFYAISGELTGEVLRVIRSLADLHITMVIVTHEMNFARQVANRIVFMDKGQIIEQAKPEDFFTNPTTDRAKTFLNILNYEPRGTNYEENI